MNEMFKTPVHGTLAEESAILSGTRRSDLLRDEVLSEIFAATADARADHPALIVPGQTLTYREVSARADAMARGLLERGVGVGDVVGLWMCRGADLLTAQIAVTKVGAAWLPFDADAPAERVGICLQDADAKILIAGETQARQMTEAPCPVLVPHALALHEGEALPARAEGLTPDHPAYVIYTSGSTGMPKGIVISHRNICHFLRSANEVYGFTHEDVVFQGASAAFDLSMEEIWIPYLVGATLVVATSQILSDIEQLPQVLTDAKVTVLDTVPTLLAFLPSDLPHLRLVLLGGEALPEELARRWATNGRRLFNTYGPTEATVVATVAEIQAGDRVTIGRPIPNYTCYVVDEELNLLPPGHQGELLIGGPGVAQGYLNRPDLTAEKFISNHLSAGIRDPLLYRSGDAVSLGPDGNLRFHGRIDDQVKIRGFRVELGEIEARIAGLPGIVRAAVVLRREEGLDLLAAFIVPQLGADLDVAMLRSELRKTLPPYMVPGHFEMVATLPQLASGKIDRKALQRVELTARLARGEEDVPQNEVEEVLLDAAKQIFHGQTGLLDADFFTELGGHSLLAARFIALVRETPALASVTLPDLYAKRTLRALADHLMESMDDQDHASDNDLAFEPPPLLRRFLCGLAQAAALPFILGLVTLQWLGLFIASVFLLQEDASLWTEMAALLGLFVAINIGTKALIIGLKWLIIGRTKPGRYPLWGVYYYRLWFVERLLQVTTVKFLQGSPLMRIYLRLLGARIGKDAIISEFEIGAVDLLTVGDHASTGLKVKFANISVVGNEVIVGPIEIGAGVTVGNSCVFGPNTKVETGAELKDLTAIQEGVTIPAYEQWDGSPSRKVGTVDPNELPPFPETTPGRRALQMGAYVLGYIAMLMLGLLPIFPAFYLLYNLDSIVTGRLSYDVSWSNLPFLAYPTALALIVVSMVIIVALRWLVLPRVKAGSYSIHSWFYVRKWLLGLATEVILETLNSLYATIYMRSWYRMMGARIGKGSEISTNLAGRYDLVEIGENNFIGDETIFGDEEISGGWMTLKPVRTGNRVFIGNDAVVAQGANLEDDTLIGVKSKLPDSLRTGRGETWFGSPSMHFPTRQKVNAEASQTYNPPRSYLIRRAIFEGVHTALPTTFFIVCGYITADLMADPLDASDWLSAMGIFLASGVVIGFLLLLVSAALKWLLMGVYKPVMKPMWSWWAMRTEAVAVLYGGLVGKASLEFLRGTPFLPWALRLYGTKIGKGVWMDCTDLTEFDCVTIGDYSILNQFAVLQTHLYEDRVMKVGRIKVGRGVTVGAGTTVLYDTQIGDHVRIRPLTVVMKGDSLPPNTEWEGAPSIPVRRRREASPAAQGAPAGAP